MTSPELLPRLVNLLDDFALGGVSRGLGIFSSAPLRRVADCQVAAISPGCLWAPKLAAEIIITHFPPNWRRLAFLVALRQRNPAARIIHVEHSYTREWEAGQVPHQQRFRAMLAIATRLVDKVVCVSAAQAQWLRQVTRLPEDRLEVIYPYSENPGLANLPLPDFSRAARLRVGAYGRFHPVKGFDRLIAAHQSGAMPATELIIGGYGPEEDRLRAQAAGSANIRFAGKIDNVAQFLDQCDLIAVPSRWEAYGQVANEAREAGRPILVSPVDGLPEQVGAAGLVIDFADPAAIKAGFASLDSGRLAAMAQAGRTATRNCGRERQEQWAGLVSRMLATQPDQSARRAA